MELSETAYRMLDEEKLEEFTHASWRSKYNFLGFFYTNVFCACVSFSIVMPSIFAYIEKHGGDDFFFASVLFIYSLGELIGALAFGYMHNIASTTSTLYLSVGCGFVGSALYALADYIGGVPALWMIFIARALQGLWTGGQQSLEQAYVSEVVYKEDNLKVNAEIGMAAVSGFIFGPVIGLALSFININIGAFAVDSFTAPGYIQLLATAIMLSQTALTFKEIPADNRRYRSPELQRVARSPNKIGLAIIYFVCLFVYNSFAVMETITAPLVTDVDQKYTESFDWDVSGAYALYAASGVMTIFAFVIIHFYSGKIDDRLFGIIGLVANTVGWALMIDYEPRQINHFMFFLGYGMISMAFPIARIVTQSLLSKLIGPCKAGAYMGWYLCIGALARCVGPYYAVEALGISCFVCFGVTAALLLLSAFALWGGWTCLQSHPELAKITPSKTS